MRPGVRAGISFLQLPWQMNRFASSTFLVSHGGTPEQWANESLKFAEAAWVPHGTDLNERFYEEEIKIVDRQMALAGLRLAKLPNDSIGKMTPRDFAASVPLLVVPANQSPGHPPSLI
jgi:hypothetical protein